MKFTLIALTAALVLCLTPFSASAQNAPDMDCDIIGQIPGVISKNAKTAILLLRCFDGQTVCHAAVTVDKKGTQLVGNLECDPLSIPQ